MFRAFGLLAATQLLAISLFAQTAPAATGPGRSLWAGAEITAFNPDYGCKSSSAFTCFDKQLLGVSAFTDINHVFWRIGGEAEGRWLRWRGPLSGSSQDSYLFGPRVDAVHYKRLAVNVKGLVGIGTIIVPRTTISGGTYLAYAPGATVDYALRKKLDVRFDYEYQIWPNFHGTLPGAGGLTPNGLSVGVSYRFFDTLRFH